MCLLASDSGIGAGTAPNLLAEDGQVSGWYMMPTVGHSNRHQTTPAPQQTFRRLYLRFRNTTRASDAGIGSRITPYLSADGGGFALTELHALGHLMDG